MKIKTNRRAFLARLTAFIAAPAIVHAGNLMPVKGAMMPGTGYMLITDYYIDDTVTTNLDVLYGWLDVRSERLLLPPLNDLSGGNSAIINDRSH